MAATRRGWGAVDATAREELQGTAGVEKERRVVVAGMVVVEGAPRMCTKVLRTRLVRSFLKTLSEGNRDRR